MDIVSVAALTGFVGDALLQVLVYLGVGDWGLKQYFAKQGRGEAMFTAAGMLAIFYTVYIAVGLPLKWQYLALYGVLLDLVFREARLFPSLDGYYAHMSYFWSAVWGAIPMVLPLILWKRLKR